MIHLIGDGGHARVIRLLLRDGGIAFPNEGWIVAVGNNRNRKKEVPANADKTWAHAKHRLSYTHSTSIGEGTVIMAGAIIQSGVTIGRHVIINTCASIDHDCVIDDYAHIAPGAVLCGNVHVGEGAQVGCGVAVAQGARIPPWTLCKARRLEYEPL